MAADFLLKQNLRMSPNSQIKNLVPENIADIPPEEEWKLGRVWFNTTIGKLQGVFLKLHNVTGEPLDPEEWEVRIVGADALGIPKDGAYWPDGLLDFTQATKIAYAMDDVNEALKDLSPPEATFLRGDLNLIDQVFKTGRTPRFNDLTPHTLRTEGVVGGEEIDYIIIDPVVKATLPTDGLTVKGQQQQQFGRADQGIIVAKVNDSAFDDGLNLEELFHEPGRDYFGVTQGFDPEITQTTTNVKGEEIQVEVNPNKLSYKSSSGSLTINTIERYNEFKKWQKGTGSVEFTVGNGRHILHVEHDEIISGPHLNEEIVREAFKTNPLNVFYDPNTIAPVIVLNTFELRTGIFKYMSGIPFFNSDITFSLDFHSNNVFNYTYWDNPIFLNMDGTNLGQIAWNHSSSNLDGLDSPLWSDIFHMTDFIIEFDSPEITVESVTLTLKAGKPATGWGAETTETIDMLVDTTPASGNSTSLKETFFDEEYRIRSTADFDDLATMITETTGTWDSSLLLSSGNAQQYLGSLMKAKDDYTHFDGIDVNYTGFADDDQEYYRRFYNSDDKPNSNGKINVVTDGIFGDDFEIQIKLPGLSAWLDVGTLLDTEIFTDSYNVDGTGCGTTVEKTNDGYLLNWSIGTLSTFDSGFGYLIKVIIKTNDFKINKLEEVSDTWS